MRTYEPVAEWSEPDIPNPNHRVEACPSDAAIARTAAVQGGDPGAAEASLTQVGEDLGQEVAIKAPPPEPRRRLAIPDVSVAIARPKRARHLADPGVLP
jgi:hypothetical protein